MKVRDKHVARHIVCVHAWRWVHYAADDGEGQEYCDWHERPDGWCVYVRTEFDDPAEPFDMLEDEDYETREQALARAEILSAKYDNCEIREY